MLQRVRKQKASITQWGRSDPITARLCALNHFIPMSRNYNYNYNLNSLANIALKGSQVHAGTVPVHKDTTQKGIGNFLINAMQKSIY